MEVKNDTFTQAVFSKHQKILKGFIESKIEDSEASEEIFQNTLIAAYQSFPLFSGKSSFSTWLCGIAKHEISDYYRKKKIKVFLFSYLPWLENLASQALGPEQQYLRKEFEERIYKTFKKIDKKYVQVLKLKYFQELTVAEIAIKLDETTKTIESRLGRARKAFVKAYIAYPY